MVKRLPTLATILVLSATSIAEADPVVLFDTFGPGNSYGLGARPILGPGAPLSEGDVTPGQWFAASFEILPGGTFAFAGVELAVSVLSRNPADPLVPVPINLSLVPDADGLPGSTALATMALTASAGNRDGGSIERVASLTNPLLLPGATYWLVASTSAPAASAGWMVSTTDRRLLPGAIRRVDGAWSRGWPNGAFRVFGEGDLDVAPVPEPGTMLLVGAGLVGAWRARLARTGRRRRKSA